MSTRFKFGFEHETAFITDAGAFADCTNTPIEVWESVVEKLPQYAKDYPSLRIGDLRIKVKRWYVEGYERFDEDGKLVQFVPKGIEIRTPPQESVESAQKTLEHDFQKLAAAAKSHGLFPTWISHHPFKEEGNIVLDPPLNAFEIKRMKEHPEERTGYRTLLTFGPDINISDAQLTNLDLVRIAKKLTCWSPFIIPFSFSSPFFKGKIWDGFSVRTYVRTGDRHAAKAFVSDKHHLIPDNPLVGLARIPSEQGRIEFKAFDSVVDFSLYPSFAALIKGLMLDDTLQGEALLPDKDLHQYVAKRGFDDEKIYGTTLQALQAARNALQGDPDGRYLDRLFEMHEKKEIPATTLIDDYKETGSIMETLTHAYEKFRV